MAKYGTWNIPEAVNLTVANESLELPAGDYDAKSDVEADILGYACGVSLQLAGDEQSHPVATFVSAPDAATADPAAPVIDPSAGSTAGSSASDPAAGPGSDAPPADPPAPPAPSADGNDQAPADTVPALPVYTHPAGPVADAARPEASVETTDTPPVALYTFTGDTAGRPATGAGAGWVVYTGTTQPGAGQ